MTIEPPVIHEIVNEIWEAMLGLDVAPASAVAPSAGREIYAAVQVTGGWEGAVIIECTEDAAQQFAVAMLGLDGEDPAEGDVHDVMGELANMVGGNLKGAVGREAELSLPTVVVGAELDLAVPGATVASRESFVAGGASFTLVVMAKASGPMAAAG
ncbi:MAG: chemotaxis protein CheX [Acidimicrobiales bacterium]